jgi:hypothetical protein
MSLIDDAKSLNTSNINSNQSITSEEFFRKIKLNTVSTGDLLLFTGEDSNSVGIKIATAAYWNHITIAVWCKYDSQGLIKIITDDEEILRWINNSQRTYTKLDPELYCFESNINQMADALTNEYTEGCRLLRCRDQLIYYTSIGLRKIKLKNTDPDGNHINLKKKITNFMYALSGKKYEVNLPTVLVNLTTGLYFQDNTETYFCSELVCDYLLYLYNKKPVIYSFFKSSNNNINNIIPKKCLPKHFSDTNRFNDVLENSVNVIYESEKRNFWYLFILFFVIISVIFFVFKMMK